MTTSEYTQYEILTEGINVRFAALTPEFLFHCENIIFGIDCKDFKYLCFHHYHCRYTQTVFERFTSTIEKIYREINSTIFPFLSNGIADLIIYLREPSIRSNDVVYDTENRAYWGKFVYGKKTFSHNDKFSKYLP